jgi:hypothetical protein
MKTIDEILATARRPEDTVRLCLRGDLVSAFQELERRLPDAATVAANLGERAEASVIAEQMQALREQMAEAEVPFLLRALPPKEWARLQLTRPGEKPKNETDDEYGDRAYQWACVIVAASSVEPAMTAEQVDELVPLLSAKQWSDLYTRSILVNTGDVSVPFSAAASELTRDSGPTSRRPPEPAEASAASSAPSRARSRRTSGTRKAN